MVNGKPMNYSELPQMPKPASQLAKTVTFSINGEPCALKWRAIDSCTSGSVKDQIWEAAYLVADEVKSCLTDKHRTGVVCVLLCFALGIANLFHISLIILFSALCL